MIKIGNRKFDTDRHTYVMGILNVTPDSFSDGGNYNNLTAAIEHTRQMIEDGADIIDVGGESTRPGYTPVSIPEEIKRVVPIIRAVRKNFDIPISLDTSKSDVAYAGIDAGADLINDISGLQADKDMAKVISQGRVPVCITHSIEKSDNSNFMDDVILDMRDLIAFAEENGIPRDKIVIDPGIGFEKTTEQNLEIIKRLDEFKVFKLPVLLGLSRKSFIGAVTGAPVMERLPGTLVCNAWGMIRGAGFIRVHDVKEHVQMVKVMEAVMNSESTEKNKEMHTSYIAYGSNVGNRQGYIDKAISLINSDPGIEITARSKTIETKPYGGVIQNDFLNGVIEVKTTYSPRVLLDKLQAIERECERVRTMRWGPRTLDLDIILFDDLLIKTDRMTIPHPDMHNREFVLAPLCEIAPDVIHPGFNKSVKKMLNELRGRM